MTGEDVTTKSICGQRQRPGDAYQGWYASRSLASWARTLCTRRRQGYPAYCYFNNDWAGYAVGNALELMPLVEA